MNLPRAEVPSLRAALVWMALGLALVAWRAPVARPASAPEVVSNDGAYRVRYELPPEGIGVRELFELRAWIVRVDGEDSDVALALDARMPEHGHGMNREPVLSRTEDGAHQVSNLLFHMPGYWEIYFDVTEGAITERAQISIELE